MQSMPALHLWRRRQLEAEGDQPRDRRARELSFGGRRTQDAAHWKEEGRSRRHRDDGMRTERSPGLAVASCVTPVLSRRAGSSLA